MIIPNYEVLKILDEQPPMVIYQGKRRVDRVPVLIKILASNYPSLEEITWLKHDYLISKMLNCSGILKPYALETYQDIFALILEDFDGLSLTYWLKNSQFSLIECLKIAIKISEVLEYLQQISLIHKNLKSSNIFFNRETGEVKLTDWTIATQLASEKPTIDRSYFLRSNLSYISPEQTGRMNRMIDFRSDLYSLGVVFYELLTGKLLFDSKDSLSLIHCHIAKQPIPPQVVNPEIPHAISDIVMKLLAKDAEDRYQSASGLKFDLETCLFQLQEHQMIQNFILGVQDRKTKLLISQKLYGREQEVQALLDAFDRVQSGSSEIMLISGYAGIGKTSIINEVHKPIVKSQGYFITGKFDQVKQNIPYNAFIQAFQELIRQLLTENEKKVNFWKEKITQALFPNTQVVIDVIPELELVVGKQPQVPKLNLSESQNRFNQVFQKFIQLFCQPEHPLVVFLDDLQWSDSASLKLIELLLSEENSYHLLIIGAYRDNEVSPFHLVKQTIEKIKTTNIKVNHFLIKPLSYNHVSQFLADTLGYQKNKQKITDLAKLIYNKSQGNPLFLNQFLKTIYEKRFLKYQVNENQWTWDINKINEIKIIDNSLVKLIAENICKLSLETQKVLQLAACIGNQFSLKILSIINETSELATAQHLWVAIQAGLIIPCSDKYKISLILSTDEFEEKIQNKLQVDYKFLHDQVQQAAYLLIPNDEKKLTHLKIGRILLQKTSLKEQEETIFEIVNQFNKGTELITNFEEKNDLSQLNLLAAKKAKMSTAYAVMKEYLKIGIELLSENSWQTQYHHTLTLYEEASEAAYFNGDFIEIQHFVNIVLQNTQNLLDQIKVYEVQIQAYIVRNQLTDAIQTALFILKHLDINLPTTLEEAQLAISEEQIETLIELPMMTDVYKLAAIKIMATVTSAAYQGMPDLFPLIIFKEINLFLNYGNTVESAFAYGCYGLVLIKMTGDIDTAYRFGQLALRLIDKLDTSIAKAKIMLVVQAHINHHKLPLKETLDFLKAGYHIGLETGDLEFAGYLCNIYCYSLLFWGKELVFLEREFHYYGEILKKIKQYKTFRYHENYRSSILQLIEQKDNAEVCRFTESDPVGNYGLFLNKLFISYLFYQYEQAYEYAKLARNYVDSVYGLYIVSVFYFYDSLVQLAIYPKVIEAQQQEILNRVVANQEKLYHLANHAPANFLHKYYLVKAEQNQILGNVLEAMDDYDKAIQLAKENEFTSEEAIANELAAKFYFNLNKIRIAQTYIADAYYLYLRWGAIAKVKDLSQRYAQLLEPILDKDRMSKNISKNITSNHQKVFSSFDLSSVIKVSQTIASEVFLNRLLARLIKILIENAGAQLGFIILEKNNDLYIEAQGDVESDTTVIGQSILVDSYRTLPLSLLKYVQKTREEIILNNASQSEQFSSDIYMVVNQPKSLLCLPIVNYGRLIGLLYLENNLIQGAFTSERLESLKILCTQAAISIENARLYEEMIILNKNLQKEIEERLLVEAALRENQEKLQAILDNSPTVVYLKDEQSRYILINHQYEKLFHLTKEQIKGKTDAEIFSPEVGAILSTNDQQVLALGKPLEFEEDVPHDDGIHTYLSIKFPLYDSEGKRYGICGISTDITERKQAELERLKFTQELATKNTALEDIQEKLAESNRTLEQKVKERTQELLQTLEVLRDTQAELLIENALLRSEQEQSQYEYQVGGSLPLDSLTYVVRHADRQLYQFLKKCQFCYVFNARQMGKSSLRIQITKRLEAEGIKCAAIDLSVLGSHQITIEQWYTGFAYLLVSELDLLSKFNIRTWWQEYQGLSPLHRLREFISQVVLKEITENIVIFIDEVDSVINLNFKVDDFFILLRSFYNQRSDSPDFNRLTFALFGVATPSQIISDKVRTPFNIGQIIYLEGFKLHEAQPLLYGLKDKVKNPQLVLNTVLSWTNGQPFLTQKVCRLIHGSTSPGSDEIAWVDNLVQTEIIRNWEAKDNPEHLKTIRDRLFNSSLDLVDLLTLYQQVWLQGEVKAVNSPEEVELVLSGLVIKQEGMLKVKNRIYYLIFNHDWIEKHL